MVNNDAPHVRFGYDFHKPCSCAIEINSSGTVSRRECGFPCILEEVKCTTYSAIICVTHLFQLNLFNVDRDTILIKRKVSIAGNRGL